MPDACASSAKTKHSKAKLASECRKTKRLALDRNFPSTHVPSSIQARVHGILEPDYCLLGVQLEQS